MSAVNGYLSSVTFLSVILVCDILICITIMG